MKRHLNTRWALLMIFALVTWLGVACAPGMQSTGRGAPAQEIVGRWRATVEMPDGSAELELILNITQSADGSFTAFMDVPSMGVSGTPITFSYNNGRIRWAVPEYGTDFNGKLIDSSTFEGTVTNPQGGAPGTMTFRRVE